MVALFRQLQDEIRQALPELHERRGFLREALSGPAASAAMSGDMASAASLLRAALARGAEALGKVQFIDASGPADLLSLRASRALAAADVLAPDIGANPAILLMARRDAERLEPGAAGLAVLVDLARNGRRVVRLIAQPALSADLQALSEAGVAVEIMLAAPAS